MKSPISLVFFFSFKKSHCFKRAFDVKAFELAKCTSGMTGFGKIDTKKKVEKQNKKLLLILILIKYTWLVGCKILF